MGKIFDFLNYSGMDSLTIFGIFGLYIIITIGVILLFGFLFHYYIIKEMRILNNKIENLTDVVAHQNRPNLLPGENKKEN